MKYSLPDSADDLLIKDGKLLMRSLSIYEALRRFRHIIRLTPFRFEDFSAALLANEQSPLISEIHIQFLRTLMREDRQQQTWLGPPDLRDSVNIYLHLADHSNWPAALKLYLSADVKENSFILERLSENESKNYPYNVNLQVKLDVLEHLCDQFLSTNLAREQIVNGNNTVVKHDTVCRSCSKANGDLLPCANCTAVYHLKCSNPPLDDYPDVEAGDEAYMCVICRSNHVKGVADCIDSNEQSGNLKRHEAIGMDKLGRRYWFLIRRLFVVDENEEDVRYYTTQKQFNEIMDNLNENRYEKSLIDNLQEQHDEIKRQMKITEDLYQSLMKDHMKDDGSYSQFLGQDGTHNRYTNHYTSSNLAVSKNNHSDRDVNRSLGNKFCMNNLNSFKYYGAVDATLHTATVSIKTTILKFEGMLPQTFVHPCWQSQRASWLRLINYGRGPEDYAIALSQLETCIKPVLFKTAWFDGVGFSQLFRSTFAEREELKKTDRQPRGFERREWFNQDFELSYRLGTMVKFSSKLKPVKHQVWKQKGEEYRLTGLNAWYWRSSTFKSRPRPAKANGIIREPKIPEIPQSKKTILVKPKLPPCHDFSTKRTKKCSLFVLPDLELHKLARCGGMRETKSFNYSAKQNNYVWPYGTTPRPTFRTGWLYRNRVINTIQDVSLQLKVLYACLRWDDLQVKPPASGHNVIATDESTITIELLKKRDRLPYLNHSEYLIKKVSTPIEQPTKYKKIGTKKATPSARSGLRARRQVEEEEVKGPTTEEIWVREDQLELWEIRQFDEKIERQNQILRDRALREEAERRRKAEEEKRRKAEQERRRRAEEEAKRVRLVQAATTPTTPSASNANTTMPTTPQPTKMITNNLSQPRSLPTTPVLRYFRTEQGQIIRLPASYLQRGTPLILRHVGPGPNQTNTYIIRPQITPTVVGVATPATTPTTPLATTLVATTPIGPTPAAATTATTTTTTTATTTTTTTTTATPISSTTTPSTPQMVAAAVQPEPVVSAVKEEKKEEVKVEVKVEVMVEKDIESEDKAKHEQDKSPTPTTAATATTTTDATTTSIPAATTSRVTAIAPPPTTVISTATTATTVVAAIPAAPAAEPAIATATATTVASTTTTTAEMAATATTVSPATTTIPTAEPTTATTEAEVAGVTATTTTTTTIVANAEEKLAESVGTVKVELAHDQRAPAT